MPYVELTKPCADQWALTPEYRSAAGVWATALNEGGWPTQGLSYCVGYVGSVAIFTGADASVHMAEEVANAALNIPRAILGAMLINGAVGFIMMVRTRESRAIQYRVILILIQITILYCLGDVDSVLNTGEFKRAYICGTYFADPNDFFE